MFAVLGRCAEFIITIFFGKDDRKADDPWKGSKGFYIARYRARLDQIAEALSSSKGEKYATRFNAGIKCVEIYQVIDGMVIAEVDLRGECGIPFNRMEITTNLPDTGRSLFTTLLPFEITFYKSARLVDYTE